MHTVGYVSDRHFIHRPARKEPLKEVPADFPMQAADAIHRAAAADCQIGHVETLRQVARVPTAERQQVLQRDAELLFGVVAEILLDECRRKTIEAGLHRRMGGKEIARSRDRQCNFKGLPGLIDEIARTLQDGKCRMSLIQMADLRMDAERAQQPPSAYSEEQLLLEAQLRPAAIQLAGDTAMRRVVGRVVAVEQVESHSADLDLPGAQPDRVSRQRDLQPQPFAVRLAHRRDRQLSWIVIREQGLLHAVSVDHLAKVALLVEQPYPDYRHAQIAGGLELISGDVAEPAGVDGQSFTQHKFHAEIGDTAQRAPRMILLKPCR